MIIEDLLLEDIYINAAADDRDADDHNIERGYASTTRLYTHCTCRGEKETFFFLMPEDRERE